ncbi:MAG: hypothetical protein SGCHY_004979 [Lobulomycetales sp.]
MAPQPQTVVYMNQPMKENTAAAGILGCCLSLWFSPFIALCGLCCFKLPASRAILLLTAGLGGLLTSFVWFGVFASFKEQFDNDFCEGVLSTSSSRFDDEREECRVYDALYKFFLSFAIIYLLVSLALAVIGAFQVYTTRGNPNPFANLNLGVNGQQRQQQQMYHNQPVTTARSFSAQSDSTMMSSHQGYPMANLDLEKNTSIRGSVVNAYENIPVNASISERNLPTEPVPRMSLESLALYLDIPKLLEASSVEQVLEMDLKSAKEKLDISNEEYLRLKKYKKEVSS